MPGPPGWRGHYPERPGVEYGDGSARESRETWVNGECGGAAVAERHGPSACGTPACPIPTCLCGRACASKDLTIRSWAGTTLAQRARAKGLRCCTKVANSSPCCSRLKRSSAGIPMREPAASRTKSGVRRRICQPRMRRRDQGDPSRRPSRHHPRSNLPRTFRGAASRTARAHSSPVRSGPGPVLTKNASR